MKSRANSFLIHYFCLTLFIAAPVCAGVADDVHRVQREWAHINYELTGKDQLSAFEKLVTECEGLTQSSPNAAEFWVWAGIVKSSYAGAKGGLGALSMAKESKRALEKAIAIDGKVLDGSAYTSLATLYAQVPGWPIGFGDDKKAKELFAKALALNPQGIDPNYFYAEFMLDQGQYAQAQKHYLIAQQALPRPDRPIADAGRHKEIVAGLAKVASKIRD